MTPLFLTCDEVRELTGIKTGKFGKRREELQAAALRTMKIPFYVNAAGRPIVSRAVIEGGTQHNTEAARPKWEPARAHG